MHYCRTAKEFLNDENGATAIEYGLIAGGVSVFVATAIWTLGDVVLVELFEKVENALFSV
ncbi:MAG: Flp family type IVb pilin [Hyphomicrobiales bacterium]